MLAALGCWWSRRRSTPTLLVATTSAWSPATAGVPATVDEALEAVELTARAGDRFVAYSLGMRQRLGLAAALLKDPELLLLDEPTNGLDPAGMAEMRVLLRRLGSGGRTVLLSSHLLGEVQQVCDRIGVLSRGRLLRGTVAELRGQGALLVTARPLEQTHAVARRLLGPDRVAVQDGALRLEAEPDQAARVNYLASWSRPASRCRRWAGPSGPWRTSSWS